MMPIVVRSASPDEASAVSAVILLAFATDPMARWSLGNAQTYLAVMPELIRAFGAAALAKGERTGVIGRDGRLSGPGLTAALVAVALLAGLLRGGWSPDQVLIAATTAGRSWRGAVIEAEERRLVKSSSLRVERLADAVLHGLPGDEMAGQCRLLARSQLGRRPRLA